MKNIILKRLFVVIMLFTVTFSNLITFAEANIIYAPTRQQTIELPAQNQNAPSSKITPDSEVSSIASYAEGSIDYVNVYSIVENNNNYYCYENGDVVRNGWRKISKYSYSLVAPVDGFHYTFIWSYFSSNGSAIKASSGSIRKVKIGNYTYTFNEYGQLLTGFFNENVG